jgi:hydrogenase expression/formation protein HypE
MNIEFIQLAHGSGGSATTRLLQQMFLPRFCELGLQPENDAALLSIGDKTLAFTIDGFIVEPPFFPGGDLGSLAVNGTINDLAVMGAKPQWLACGFIISAGVAGTVLERIVTSMQKTAMAADIQLVAGDTKVIESQGKSPQILVTTAGLGILETPEPWHTPRVKPGDQLILSGTIGEHTLAVLGARHDWFQHDPIISDCANLYPMLEPLHSLPGIHWVRDITRGGLGGVCNELAHATGLALEVNEEKIPISSLVRGWCEVLGYDPLYLANEGKALLAVDQAAVPLILSELQKTALGKHASLIGEISPRRQPVVILNTSIGGRRLVPAPAGELFPRIC